MQVLGRIVVVVVEHEVPEDLHDPYIGREVGHQALLLHLHHLRANGMNPGYPRAKSSREFISGFTRRDRRGRSIAIALSS